jgi:acyl-CoA reductase-like NAD-dependent aldehyde dehydrogenase
MAIASINPTTGEKLKEFSPFDDAEIEKRLKRSEEASRKYRRTAFSRRSELMESTAELLLQEKERLAEIITLEMGKLFRASVEEILKCVRACRFYADNAERFLEDGPQLCPLPTARAGPRHHALEFPVLAGISVCYTGAYGRQCGFTEACFECAAVCPCH